MITARLKNKAGEILTEIRLPEHLHEMTLQQFVSFDSAASGEGNPIAIMAEAVQDFTGVDMRTIVEAQVGNVYEKAEVLDDTLRTVFGYISRLVTGYQPKIYSEALHQFQYKGDTYQIPYIRTLPLGLGEVLPDISVVEAIEALELLRSEAMLTAIAAANLAHGVVLGQTDRDRLNQAAARINWLHEESSALGGHRHD